MNAPTDATGKSRHRGLPIVLSAPSGTGKSTIATRLLEVHPHAVLSTSCTTRTPRAGEKDGEHYFFATNDEFKRKIEAGEFLEWAIVHGNYYGTPLKALEDQLNKGRDVVLTIDPQGALSVKRIYPAGVFVFVVPPSWDVLMKRLYKRATDDPQSMELRIANARKELAYLGHYEYVVVNDDLEKAVDQVRSIIMAEHLKTGRLDRRSVPILE
jgi:guanylate kinase